VNICTPDSKKPLDISACEKTSFPHRGGRFEGGGGVAEIKR